MLQPFKNITIIMKDKTSDGMKPNAKKDTIVETGSKKYIPIKLDGTTNKKEHMGVAATSDTDVVIGVVMETFDKPEVGTEILVQGVVEMTAASAINPGERVTVSNAQGNIKKATSTNSFGTALTKATKANDVISVLIGVGGGVM